MTTPAPILRAAFAFAAITASGGLRADVIDDYGALTSHLQEATLNACAVQANPAQWTAFRKSAERLSSDLSDPVAAKLWEGEIARLEKASVPDPVVQARMCGEIEAQLEYVCSLELLGKQKQNDIKGAQEWRALITLPKHANAIEGALALQSQLSNSEQIAPITRLLARECLEWQAQRIREKLGTLQRLIEGGQYNQTLLEIRFSEIAGLAQFNGAVNQAAGLTPAPSVPGASRSVEELVAAALPQPGGNFAGRFQAWRTGIEIGLPNFLSPQEVARHERLLLKLVKLVPKEYGSGVRDGQITVPLEYREAVMFIVQAQQLTDELNPVWTKTRAAAQQQYHEELAADLTRTETLIHQKADPDDIQRAAEKTGTLLENKFGLSLRRSGNSSTALEETVLDIRTSLKNSLAAAQAGNWEQAESHRLDAYTTFDGEIEKRVLPRDYALGIKTERGFLDGQAGKGIKAALDAHRQGPDLEAVYEATLDNVTQCQSLLKVGLSPATVMFTTVSIVAREGLEAIVILAALLAGLRGEENRSTRRWIARGAWLALLASALTFWLSRTLIESLSRYGEKLEAVVSVLAVVVLLIVTNWVFHKYYWAEWNTKLRTLTKASRTEQTGRWQWLALVSVGFVTIYREGFEVSLFMQSLLMEGSQQAVLAGVLLSVLLIAALGTAIFVVGTKLPIRKMLVVTGLFIVSILVTFLGSTVRIFQTVGWLPIHPLEKFEIPTWMGQWLGLYPSWEGLTLPFLGISYVGGAWLYMKITAAREQRVMPVPVKLTPAVRETAAV
jgi:high-affinity iron transporter